ncbi:MAG TPA: choice-of-anchor J domain-containing protein, partial [Candidatus Paceibacterota bacterium]|nr:choice-of-anchor J domain-containing protein [Candidatus Paceibacterota bacterium]
DHAAYVGTPGTNHAVTISGLSANRIYYYEVVSRDQAGNTTVDDNNGNLYTFQTLKAPTPPWFDNLESGAPGWTVVPDPVNGSDINWTLGTPNNGLVTSAHSGTNAWGSDLDGSQNFFLASSYLYSPVIGLTGLKSATLTFYDACDFSGPYEDGVVYVSTNSSTPPGDLPMAADLTGTVDDWDQETVDLTPWVGQTIQVVFYYEGVVVDQVYGWTIDDIGITGESSGGNIGITKNLGQGTWSLSSLSPIGLVPVQSDVTPSVTISNLPAGQYVAQFSDVPFYQTPLTQTNTLAAGGTIYFNGNYAFLDANNNGISDAWEQYYFGSVTTNRTQQTDSDGDGMSDYAEFIAGTDPTNPASRFYFTGETVQSNLVQMQWTVVTNRLYQLSVSTNLQAWLPATGWLQASNTPTMSFTVTNTRSGSRFYRVQVLP